MVTIFFAFITALAISFIATPFVIWLAHRLGAIDVPLDDRRVHSVPIPRLGGLAIFISFFISVLIFSEFEARKLFGLLLGSIVIIIIGMVDDIKPVKARVKFLFQIIGAIIIYYFGFRVQFFTNVLDPDQLVILGYFSFPATIFWIVGITNTINFIDGLDGLSVGVSTISAITLAYVAYNFNSAEVMLLAIIIVGANMGFLPYNFNPAKIFAGDTGAMFLGFVLAAISIEGVMKSATIFSIFIPLLALGLPIFDTTFAIVRRTLSGKKISEADKGHLHHRLLSLGMGQKKAVLSLYVIAGLMGLGVVWLVENLIINTVLVLCLVAVLLSVPIYITSKRNELK